MNPIKHVISFELNSYFKNKGYTLVTVLMTLLLVVGICIPTIMDSLGFNDKENSKDNNPVAGEENPGGEDTREVLLIYDPSGIISNLEYIETTYATYKWKVVSSKEEMDTMIKENQAEAGYQVDSAASYTYVVNNTSMYDSKSSLFQNILSYFLRYNYMVEHNIDVAEFEQIYSAPIEMNENILGKDSVGSYWYTYVLVFLIYLLIMIYGQMIAVSVTTEKSNRAIEVLITSTKPNALIFGKVFAGAIASFLQVAVVLGAGVITYRFNREAWDGALDGVLNIPVEVLATFFVFLVFGFLFYSFLYGALGALVSKTEDISKAVGPVMFIFMAGFFIAMYGLQDSDSMLVKVCSFIPFTSCYTMIIRVAMGTVNIVEIIISVVILIASCFVTGMLGAKVYRMATLHYGNPIKLTTILMKLRKKQE